VATGFQGFPEEALAFLGALKKSNRREWFQARKDVYEERVKRPMAEMVAALNSRLERFAPDYVTDPRKAIFRIYRDTRFSRDKTPYKTNIAASFPRRGLGKGASAGLYFSVSPGEIEVAGGIYMPGPDELRVLRGFLAQNHHRLRKVLAGRRLGTLMGGLWDQQFARVPRGFPPEHPAADLLRYRHWVVYTLLDPDLVTTPRLFDDVLARFRVMVPFVELLNEPLLAAAKKLRLEDLLVP
jgi:uncharacterized protein (TIGR02453 family)